MNISALDFHEFFRHTGRMPKRSSKQVRQPDANKLAFSIVQTATGGSSLPETVAIVSGKNPAAVTLGRLGGLKGGLARAKKLSKKARTQIARKAALARWGNKHGKKEGSQRPKAKTTA